MSFNPIPTPRAEDEARFWTKVDRRDSAECWLWRAPLNDSGYGSFGMQGKTYRAHRVSYVLAHGDLDRTLQIDHLCRNRACVNPAHLEPVTNQVNAKRGEAGLHRKRECAQITHCPQGHEYTPENTLLKKGANGKLRSCRKCHRARQDAAYWAAKAQKLQDTASATNGGEGK